MSSTFEGIIFCKTPLYFLGGKDVVHLAHRIDRYNYRFCCGVTVGGVVGFTKEQFQKVNGFSNMFNVSSH